MTDSSRDRIDGFLMVGNQPALDLLNTRLLVGEQQQEMLTDTAALVRWLQVSGLVARPGLRLKLKSWGNDPEARVFLRQLVIFRENLRDAVLRFENEKQLTTGFLRDLNLRLFTHPLRKAVMTKGGILQSEQVDGPTVSDTLWAALLNEVESLLTDTEPNRVRKCENCVVHFKDLSKKNARRWCSMRLCGNKAKVAAYQDRQRKTKSSSPTQT